jgi:hypothetical protein
MAASDNPVPLLPATQLQATVPQLQPALHTYLLPLDDCGAHAPPVGHIVLVQTPAQWEHTLQQLQQSINKHSQVLLHKKA